MLKMVGDAVRGPRKIKLVVLGLSDQNIMRLEAGEPIAFAGEEVDVPGVEFLIFAGRTEATMARELADLIGPDTKVRMDPRTTD